MSPLKLPEILADKSQELSSLILAIATGCICIANQVKNSALEGNLGVIGIVNVPGELQQTLNLKANDLFVKIRSANTKLAAIVSKEVGFVEWSMKSLERALPETEFRCCAGNWGGQVWSPG